MLGGTIEQTTDREPYPTAIIVRKACTALVSSSGCIPFLETVGTISVPQEQATHKPLYDNSTLEAADALHFRHSTLELIPAYHKEAYRTVDAADKDDGRAVGGFMNHMTYGMRMK